MMSSRAGDAHMNGDCWPSQCPACQAEADQRPPLSGVYGQCHSCGAIETNLVTPAGTKDLSAMGESDAYPFGYGCELCA